MILDRLLEPIDRDDNSMSGIQLYAMSVFALILVASLMALNAMNFSDFARIVAACATLIGMYAFFFSMFRRHDISALVFIGSLIFIPLLPYLRYAAYLAGALGWVVLIRTKWKIAKRELFFLPVIFVAIFGSSIYSDFQYHNALAMGAMHIDTLFHAAIAAMYSHYGVASIGLDGLVPIAYHTLSHKIMAGIATLSGFETLAVYSYLFFAMGPLLLTFSLAGLAWQLNSHLKFPQALLGIALVMLVIIVVPVFGWAAMWDSYFASESYLVALVILTASLAALIRWIEGGAVSLWLLATSLLLLILAGLAKGSVGLVGICVFGLLGITKYRNLKYWLLLVVAAALIYLGVIDLATSTNANQLIPLAPFDFVLTYTKPPFSSTPWAQLCFFMVVHFLPIWACFAIGLRKSGYAYLKTIEFQILIALLLPALFFSLTFKIGGGSAYYFSSIPVVVSLPFLLSDFPVWQAKVKFWHVIAVAILASLMLHTAISGRSLMSYSQGKEANIDGLQGIVKQLRNIRDNSSANILVKIENPELLVSKVGCKAYWFFPAVMERPVIDGLPNKDLCPGTSHGYYGLSDYHVNENKHISADFKIIQLKIDQQKWRE